MPKKQTSKPTEAELEILQVLWNQGPSTVRVVHDAIGAKRDIGYTTTLKLMQMMHEKGLVQRSETQRAHVYYAAQSATKSRTSLIHRVVDQAFSGSTKELVLHALRSTKASSKDLQEIRAELDRIERESKK